MVKCKVFYLLSKEGQKKSLLEGGNGKQLQVVEADFTPEWAEFSSILPTGEPYCTVGFAFSTSFPVRDQENLVKNNVVPSDWSMWTHAKRVVTEYRVLLDAVAPQEDIVTFDDPQTPDSLLAWLQKNKKRCSETKAAAEKRVTELKQQEEERRKKAEEERCQLEEQRRIENEKREKEKQEKLQEMMDWIQKHGSERLQKTYSLGYTAPEDYYHERAEFFAKSVCTGVLDGAWYAVVDTCDFGYHKKVGPSLEALQAFEQLLHVDATAQIVYVPEGDRDELEIDIDTDGEFILVTDIPGLEHTIKGLLIAPKKEV